MLRRRAVFSAMQNAASGEKVESRNRSCSKVTIFDALSAVVGPLHKAPLHLTAMRRITALSEGQRN